MSLPDGAEYWWDVKSHRVYAGRDFRHHPNYNCSHINNVTGNTATTPYIEDINCFECIEAIKKGNKTGLIEGKATETYYMSNSEKKKFNKQKRFREQHGKCSCGSDWQIRKNSKTGEEFLGCSNYPKCKKTKPKKIDIMTTIEQSIKIINDLDELGVTKSGGLKKTSELPDEKICTDREHNPPQNYCYKNGVYEYTCPSCFHVQVFTVRNPTL